MAFIDRKNKVIHCKIVYYGPAAGGKSSNLQYIHEQLPASERSELYSVATETERLLFFDFTHPDFKALGRWSIRFHLHTIPGAVLYELSRVAVLRDVDGVVFVADSQRNKIAENVKSLSEVAFMLDVQKKLFAQFPLVLQYNKRDVPNALPVERINFHLNRLPWQYVLSIAPKGEGVMQTLDAICGKVRNALLPSTPKAGEVPESLRPLVDNWKPLVDAANQETGSR